MDELQNEIYWNWEYLDVLGMNGIIYEIYIISIWRIK